MVKKTNKTGIRIYVNSAGLEWITAFPPSNTACGNVSACADWAIAQFRKGAVSAVSRLDVHEREAVISSQDGCHGAVSLWDYAHGGADSFALYIEGWFTTGSGVSWKWKSQQILSLITKIRSMNPSEIAGLICWALGYWQKEGTPREVSIRQYSEDLEQIYAQSQCETNPSTGSV